MHSVYEMTLVEPQMQKVESIAVTNGGRILFVGTSDGLLMVYEVGPSTKDEKIQYECTLVETIRKSKEKRPITSLKIIEQWNTLIGIMDGVVAIYNLETCVLITQLNETKGCTAYTCHATENLLCIILNKKILLYQRQGSLFLLKKEINSPSQNTPRTATFTQSCLIIGYRRYYDIMDFNLGNAVKIIDIEREHRMVVVELPPSQIRPASIALSGGSFATLVHVPSTPSPTCSPFILADKLEWSSTPLASLSSPYHAPFLISLLQNAIEVHDLSATGSLTAAQRIFFPSPIAACACDLAGPRPCWFVASTDSIVVLRMIPLVNQITSMGQAGQYEEALSLLAACTVPIQSHSIWEVGLKQRALGSVISENDEKQLRRRFALSLFQRGDFEGSISQHILADTPPIELLEHFPEFAMPGQLPEDPNNQSSRTVRLNGAALSRVASSMVAFCEHHREKVCSRANRVERRLTSQSGGTIISVDRENEFESTDPHIREAMLLDSMLLNALLSCSPPRRNAVVDLLSKKQFVYRGQFKGSSQLLASFGTPYIEAMLWLYRSRGFHQKVLSALTEDRCVQSGFWTREQLQLWMCDYLKELWQSPEFYKKQLCLTALKPLLEQNPELGMEVLTPHSQTTDTDNAVRQLPEAPLSAITTDTLSSLTETTSTKDIGTATSNGQIREEEVVQYLLALSPITRGIVRTTCTSSSSIPAIPLLSGRALAVTYLEWLVAGGRATSRPELHDQYAQLLMEGIPLESVTDHSVFDLSRPPVVTTEDTVVTGTYNYLPWLYFIYRSKLQLFLQSSEAEYRPERVMQYLPTQFQQEYALLLSKLGKHDEALRIYIHQLRNLPAAEAYCDRLYQTQTKAYQQYQQSSLMIAPQDTSGQDIYLHLLRVILASDLRNFAFISQESPLTVALAIAEKYLNRVNPMAFLDLLPPSTPTSSITRYLDVVFEQVLSRKKNLQVVYQLLRVQEVRLRAEAASGLLVSMNSEDV